MVSSDLRLILEYICKTNKWLNGLKRDPVFNIKTSSRSFSRELTLKICLDKIYGTNYFTVR